MIAALQPAPGLIALALAMFRKARDARQVRARDIPKAAKRQIASLEEETAPLLDRILGASNMQVIAAYKVRLAGIEKEEALMAEKRDAPASLPARSEENRNL